MPHAASVLSCQSLQPCADAELHLCTAQRPLCSQGLLQAAASEIYAAVQVLQDMDDSVAGIVPRYEHTPLLCNCLTLYIFRHEGESCCCPTLTFRAASLGHHICLRRAHSTSKPCHA